MLEEFLFQLFCLNVIDKIADHNPAKPVKVCDFLIGLFGEEIFNSIKTALDKDAIMIFITIQKY